MKRKSQLVCTALGAAFLCSCNHSGTASSPESEVTEVTTDSARVSGIACDISIAGISFTKSINGADTLVAVDETDKVTFRVGEKKDYFCDPSGGLSNNTAPVLLTQIDNTKPFTFVAKVTPLFTETGVYDAGVLYLYSHDNFWQKLCFEQDERGKHRIVTVRTVGTSDDNNHDVVEKESVYLKISSDTRRIGSYYSLDKETWHMVRVYENNYPSGLFLGISAQCPVEKGSLSYFEEMELTTESVSDFRMGI